MAKKGILNHQKLEVLTSEQKVWRPILGTTCSKKSTFFIWRPPHFQNFCTNNKIFAYYSRGDSGDWFEHKMWHESQDLLIAKVRHRRELSEILILLFCHDRRAKFWGDTRKWIEEIWGLRKWIKKRCENKGIELRGCEQWGLGNWIGEAEGDVRNWIEEMWGLRSAKVPTF